MQDLSIQIGPASFRIASAWREPVEQLERLYAAYPKPEGGIADFTVRLKRELQAIEAAGKRREAIARMRAILSEYQDARKRGNGAH